MQDYFKKPLASAHNRSGKAYFQFDINGTSNPDGLVDPGGIVSTIVRLGAGSFLVTLKSAYYMVRPMATIYTAADQIANCNTITDGRSQAASAAALSPSSFRVTTLTANTGAAVETDNATVAVEVMVIDTTN